MAVNIIMALFTTAISEWLYYSWYCTHCTEKGLQGQNRPPEARKSVPQLPFWAAATQKRALTPVSGLQWPTEASPASFPVPAARKRRLMPGSGLWRIRESIPSLLSGSQWPGKCLWLLDRASRDPQKHPLASFLGSSGSEKTSDTWIGPSEAHRSLPWLPCHSLLQRTVA